MSGRKIEYSTKKKTKLPNASTLGYGQWQAVSGDFIVYKETYTDGSEGRRYARVIGEITYTDSDGDDGRGMLLVLSIGDSMTFGYERWVDPKQVVECMNPVRVADFMLWLFNDATPESMFKYIRDDLRTRQAAHPARHNER